MESPKDATKISKTTFKIIFRSQNSSHFFQNSRKNSKLKDKTQELDISLIPSCRKNGQKQAWCNVASMKGKQMVGSWLQPIQHLLKVPRTNSEKDLVFIEHLIVEMGFHG